MPRKFRRYEPKGASKKRLKRPKDATSTEVVDEEIVTTDSCMQTEVPELKHASV